MITAAVRELGFGQAINEAIRQEMRRDPTIVVMGEDVARTTGHVFTHDHNRRVATHFLANRFVNGLAEAELSHGGSGHSRSPLGAGTYTSVKRSAGWGNGLDSAKATASSIFV